MARSVYRDPKRIARHHGYIKRWFQKRGEIPNRRRWNYDWRVLVDESVLSRDWDTPESDEVWSDL